MNPGTTFDEALDIVEHLPDDQQADLIEVIRRRLVERGRQQIVVDAEDARREFAQGQIRPMTVDELMREIGS